VDLSVEVPQAALDYLNNNLPSVTVPELTATGEVKTTAPMICTAGVSVSPVRQLELKVDIHWINYSSTAVMIGNVNNSTTTLIGDQVLIKARDDALLTGLQANYRFPFELTGALRLEYDRNSSPELYASPVSIDFHRFSFHIGGAWQATRWLALTLEYSHYIILDRTITQSRFGPSANPTTPEEQGFDKPSPTGRYFVEADRLGLGLLFNF
jgi:long-subunit fatty acid transport protein